MRDPERHLKHALQGDASAWPHAFREATRRNDEEMQFLLLRIEQTRTGKLWEIPRDLTPPAWHGVTLRWDARVARLFRCDCAERVIHLYEAKAPRDTRLRRALEASRAYAMSDTTPAAVNEAHAAARDAAWEARERASHDDSWHAAKDAAMCVIHGSTSEVALYAVRAASRAASQIPGDEAADAAWSDERMWQRERLAKYLLGMEP